MIKIKKIVSSIFTVMLLIFISPICSARNVNNYFQQPGSGKENTLVINGIANVPGILNVSGTQTVSGTLNVTGTSSFDTDLTVSSITVTNLLTCGTIDTGQGATEVYAMNQDVETTDDITFAKLTLNGDFNLNSFVVMTDSGTVTISSSTVIVATKAGAMEIDLPNAATSAGKIFTIKKTDADASIVSLDANGGTIDGADPYNEIDAQYDFVTIISDGTNWHIISKYITP